MNNSNSLIFNCVPGNVSYLSTEINDPRLESVNMNLTFNSDTLHVQAEKVISDSYYDDYLMTTSYSESQKKLQSDQLNLLTYFLIDSKDKKLLEVGCGDGHFLQMAKSSFSIVQGIEPSRKFCEVSKNLGLDVKNLYLDSSTLNQFKNSCDCIVSRQVFEHLENPFEMLRYFFEILKEGGVGLIEVPNGIKALSEQRFFDFFPDHLQYYSINSLSEFVTKAGFEILQSRLTLGTDYIEIYFKKNDKKRLNLNSVLESRNSSLSAVRKFISSGDEEVTIWGAGAKSQVILWLLSKDEKEKIKGAIDSDPNKDNKYFPNSQIKISLPSNVDYKPKRILVLALSYLDEINILISQKFPGAKVFFLSSNEVKKYQAN